ncbi:MAG: carbohydrate ABC transporter permease [Thermoflexales bacterium]|nr:carbohydrate ABC transporter permease [Thermoflexales bacterium]
MKSKAQSMAGQKRRSTFVLNIVLFVLCTAWIIPTLGLLVSSVRNRDAINTSGWWSVLPHQAWTKTRSFDAPTGTGDGPITIEGVSATFEQFREGVTTPDGKRLKWEGNRRLGVIQVEEMQWTMDTNFTLANYERVLAPVDARVKETLRDGSVVENPGEDIGPAFINTVTVAVPATIIPILIAAFAAYAFAWMNFPGRKMLFAGVVALLVVPLQTAMIPMLRDFVGLQINGTFLAVWLAHTTFGLPLATYLLYNYISQLPRETLEAASIDGASHFTTFLRLVLPLSLPALASFAIFQFIWVWNDYLVGLIFLGGAPSVRIITQRLVDMVGTRGQDWQLLTAGAFISMLLPMSVFLALQRFFVRGLLAGSVKG